MTIKVIKDLELMEAEMWNQPQYVRDEHAIKDYKKKKSAASLTTHIPVT